MVQQQLMMVQRDKVAAAAGLSWVALHYTRPDEHSQGAYKEV